MRVYMKRTLLTIWSHNWPLLEHHRFFLGLLVAAKTQQLDISMECGQIVSPRAMVRNA